MFKGTTDKSYVISSEKGQFICMVFPHVITYLHTDLLLIQSFKNL